METLRAQIPELLQVAAEVGRRPIAGIAAYKPAGSSPEKEAYVYDFVGMLGLPLAPCHLFPDHAPAAFFPVHALKDPDFVRKFTAFVSAGKPVLITDSLARQLAGKARLDAPNVQVLAVNGKPRSLLDLPTAELDRLRQPLLKPLQTTFHAPNKVGLYLFRDGSWVVENFNDTQARVELNNQAFTVAARGWKHQWK